MLNINKILPLLASIDEINIEKVRFFNNYR